MKKFVCQNQDCDTKERCVFLADSLATEPTLCPFEARLLEGKKPWEIAEYLMPIWVANIET